MWSKAEKHMEDDEVVEAVLHPSRLDMTYLKWYLLGCGLALVTGFFLFADPQLKEVLPSWVGQQELWMTFLVPAFLVGVTEVRRLVTWYHFTDRKIMKETGLLNKGFVTVHYTNVTETMLQQPVYKSMFNIGDVQISTAGQDGAEITLVGIKDPEQYKVMIGSKSSVAHLPHQAPASAGNNTLSVSNLEAEMNRIQRQRNDLEQAFSNQQIGKYEYNRRWYMLEGEERIVQYFLDRVDGADE